MSAAAQVIDLGEYRNKKKASERTQAAVTAVGVWLPVFYWVPMWR